MNKSTATNWNHVVRTALNEVHHWSWNPPDEPLGINVTLVDPYFGGSHATPIDRVLVDLPVDVGETDLLIIRGVTREEIANSRISVDELKHRISVKFGGEPAIGLLDFANEGGLLNRLKYIPLDDGGFQSHEVLERWLRATEMHSQLHRTGAIYRPGDMHFQLPSGVHADAYIRVADAFDDITAVSRISDWLQHLLTKGTVLLSDTWTTLPLLQELVHRLRLTHTATENGFVDKTAERIISFPEYPTLTEIRQTLARIPSLVVGYPDAKVLFLISVVSSGDLLRTLKSLMSEYLADMTLDVVALVDASPQMAEVDAFAIVPTIQRFDVSRGPCKLCLDTKTRPVVLIDPRRYFPVFQAEHRAIMLKQKFAVIHHRFWEIASLTQAVRVHVDDHSTGQGRHLHVAIDVTALLTNNDFAHKVRLTLSSFAPDTNLILIPLHEATEALRAVATKQFPDATIKVVDRNMPDNNDLRKYLSEALTTQREILIFDDATISGRTLRSLHRLVQDVAHEVADAAADPLEYHIRAFVVVARPERPNSWVHLQDSFSQRGRGPFLNCSVLLPLPNTCPWCEEQQFLDQLNKRFSAKTRRMQGTSAVGLELLRRRIRLLETAAIKGFSMSIFLTDRGGDLTATTADWLSPNSLFGQGLSETAAYAAVCTAMQMIRFDPETAGRQGTSWYWDIIRIINAYHDPILQASFLRLAHRDELLVPQLPELMANIQNTLFDFGSRDLRQSAVIISEHALAAAMEKYGSNLRQSVLSECIRVAKSWNNELRFFLEEIASAQQTV
jgi:hypothetical protein